MFKQKQITMAVRSALIASTAVVSSAPLLAQEGSGKLEEVIVTATAGGRSQLESSMSVTSIDADIINEFKPSSENDLFRLIPGIQTPGTAGPGGNSNIAVRGLAVATGGSPFVQIQEDGLPTVLFGDIQFGNNDYWTRYDSTTERVESVRGGTAATFASQAPGAIINYISRTGEEEGGHLRLSAGMNYDEYRADFRYGGPIGDDVTYHVGGYIKNGRGPLDPGFDVSDSIQIKANITKNFEDGYTRFYFKYADTEEPNYTGCVVRAKYNGRKISNPKSYPGFDCRDESNWSVLNQKFRVVNRKGVLETVEMNGITTESFAIGNETEFYLGNDFTVMNKFRWTDMSGTFTAPFLNAVRTDALIGSELRPGVTIGSIVYSNGPNAGQDYDQTYLNNNVNIHTNIRDVGNVVNDLTVSKEFSFGNNFLFVRAGYFYMDQDIAADWHPNQTFSELSGNNPAMLDLYDDAGNQLTSQGIAGYNNNWGECCARDYSLSYTDTAPYLALEFDTDLFTVDVSGRWENIEASGWTVQGGQTFNTEVDGVQIPTLIPNGAEEYLDYDVDYNTWTAGALWKATENTSLFVRASEGARFNADRQTVSGKINADGSLNQAGRVAAVDEVDQYEIGIKHRGEIGSNAGYTAEFTLLQAEFAQSTFELSATRCPGGSGGCVIDAEYESEGFEFYGTLWWGNLFLAANATYTEADRKLAGSSGTDNAPYMPDLIYTVVANYTLMDNFMFGMNITGQSKYYDDPGNEYPASYTMGGVFRWMPTEKFEFAINGYNLTNEIDMRGQGAIADASVTPAVVGTQTAIGRTFTVSAQYNF